MFLPISFICYLVYAVLLHVNKNKMYLVTGSSKCCVTNFVF